MNDPIDDLATEQLERITAPCSSGDAASSPLGEEAAGWREGWLAFGRLLESANDDFDEAALLAQVRRAVEVSPSPARVERGWGRWIWAAAAASVVGALVAWRAADRDQDWSPHNKAAPENIASERTPSETAPADAPSMREYAWDDALDERLAEAHEQLLDAGSEWRGYDAPCAAIDWRLQEFSEAMGEEAL